MYLMNLIMKCESVAALLAENGRLKNLSAIINVFKVIMTAHRGDLNVEVTVAQVNHNFLNSPTIFEFKK